jgi:hypothetical protein
VDRACCHLHGEIIPLKRKLRDFRGCGKIPVLYQGTTLVVPQLLENIAGL